ncbi:MAG: hypothetical protein ACJA01_001444 [Saprospiraceae bacterium]|jgi:hypothetical protein
MRPNPPDNKMLAGNEAYSGRSLKREIRYATIIPAPKKA